MNRRTFVLSAGSGAAASRAWGANNRIRLGIIGSGGRGKYLMRQVNEVGGAEWVAVADVYNVRRDEAQALAGNKIEQYRDYRRLIERKDIDAVIIAAPDHWHARMLMDTVHTAKDVFCEKPMTASPMQGHAVVKAVKETARIVQIGTQQRSIPVIQEAKQKFVDSGTLGNVTMVHCYWNLNGGYVMPATLPPELATRPADLDWNAWLGPLPKIPWDPKRYIRPFVFWGPSTGPSGNLLIHFLDVIHWYLKIEKPTWAVAMGGIYHCKDGRDVPDTFTASLEYPEGVIVSYDCCSPDQTRKEGIGLIFMGTGGRLHVFRNGYRFIPANAELADVTAPGREGNHHMQNWLDCIRSRRQPNANVDDGHKLATACHLANIAYFEKRPAYWQDSWNLEV